MADLFFPLLLVELRRQRGIANRNLWLLHGKVWRRIVLISPHLGIGLDFNKGLRRLFIHVVSIQPEHAGDGVRPVIQRKRGCGDGMEPVFPVSIVQLTVANPDRDIGIALMAANAGHNGAATSNDNGAELFIHRIADEIRRRVSLAQGRHGPLQFLLHGLQQYGIWIAGLAGLSYCSGYKGDGQKQPQKQRPEK